MPYGDAGYGEVGYGDIKSSDGDILLDVPDVRHEHNSQSAIWENFVIDVIDSRHKHYSDNAILSQIYQILSSSARQIHRADTRTIIDMVLSLVDTVHYQRSSVSVSADFVLSVLNSKHTHAITSTTLNQVYGIIANNIRHILRDETNIIGYGYLRPQSTRQVNRILDAILYLEGEEVYKLIVSSIIQKVIDDISVKQENVITSFNTVHTHRIEDAILNDLIIKLFVSHATHEVNVETVLLSQIVQLAVRGAYQSIRDKVSISQEQLLNVTNIRQLTRIEDAIVNEGIAAFLKLIVQSARHEQRSNIPILTQLHQIIASDIRHPHVARMLGVAVERIPMIIDTFIEMYMQQMSIDSFQPYRKKERNSDDRKIYNA